MTPGELDYMRLRRLVKSLEKDVQRERDLRLLLEKRCRMYAAPIREDGHGYHANSFMAVPITQKDRPDAPDLENVGNVRRTQSPSISRSTHDTRIQHPRAD